MFADNARRLAGYAGAVLHWTPQAFWASTPDELAAIFECLAGDRPVPGGADEIARLMEVFPDG
jgi:Phage tail assembly chaperone protein, TAC